MPADAKKRVRAQLKHPAEVKTIWDHLESDDIVDPPIDITGAIYPKRTKIPFNRNDVTKQPTRVLLNWLASARASGDTYGPSYDALKAELAKREHVPSQREGSALRRKKFLGKHKANEIAKRRPV